MFFNGKRFSDESFSGIEIFQSPTVVRGSDYSGSYKEILATHPIKNNDNPRKAAVGVLAYLDHKIERESRSRNSRILNIGISALVLGDVVFEQQVNMQLPDHKTTLDDTREQAIEAAMQKNQ